MFLDNSERREREGLEAFLPTETVATITGIKATYALTFGEKKEVLFF